MEKRGAEGLEKRGAEGWEKRGAEGWEKRRNLCHPEADFRKYLLVLGRLRLQLLLIVVKEVQLETGCYWEKMIIPNWNMPPLLCYIKHGHHHSKNTTTTLTSVGLCSLSAKGNRLYR